MHPAASRAPRLSPGTSGFAPSTLVIARTPMESGEVAIRWLEVTIVRPPSPLPRRERIKVRVTSIPPHSNSLPRWGESTLNGDPPA